MTASSGQESTERTDMSDIRIEVTIYAGYRGAERPSSFLFEGSKIEVLEVLEMRVEEDHRTRMQKRFFIIRGSDHYVYTLYQDVGTAEWFLRSRQKKKEDLN
jgi:protein-tyrosine phosphatase